MTTTTNEHTFPLTFRTKSPDLDAPLKCALDRINKASGLNVQATANGKHRVMKQPRETMHGMGGWTTGKWEAANVRVADDLPDNDVCPMLIHEICQHVLPISNDHTETGYLSYYITERTLTSICEKQPCTNFEPETP